MTAPTTYITPEVKAYIGREIEVTPQEASRENITFWAQAIRHSPQVPTGHGSKPADPLYSDDEYGRRTRWGGQIAPPLYVQRLWHLTGEDEEKGKVLEPPINLPRGVNGGTEYELYEPIRPGDVITLRIKVADIFEREGRAGKLVITVKELTYTNQLGQVVAKLRTTGIKF